MVIREDIPVLLFMKDVPEKVLDICIQGRYVSLRERRQPRTLENYFSICRWSSADNPYVLYIEREFQTLHRIFWAPLYESFSINIGESQWNKD